MKKEIILVICLAVVVGLICYGVGYAHGSTNMAQWVAEKMVYFVDVDIDTEMLARDLYNYKNNIDTCYP